MFLKEVSFALQRCIYAIKILQKHKNYESLLQFKLSVFIIIIFILFKVPLLCFFEYYLSCGVM